MKIKLFLALEIQYFGLRIIAFTLYVYYVTRGFITSARASNLLTRAFNLPTRAFNFLNCRLELVIRGLELVIRRLELVTCGTELVPCGIEFVPRGFELVTRVLLFHNVYLFYKKKQDIYENAK